MHDLVVAGGGPVGMAAALHAHRAGLDVVLVEPRDGAIDKACGEGLMPGAVAELADLGVDPHGLPLSGIRYLDGSSGLGVTAPFAAGLGRGVRRTVLHDALSRRVADAGITVSRAAVQSVEDAGDHLLVDGRRTRYLVAADGLHSPVRRLVGLDEGTTGRRRFGQRIHVEQPPWTSYVEVHWSHRAEAYVTPVADDLVGVAVLGGAGARFEDLLADFPVLQDRLTGIRSRVMGAGPLRQRVRARSSGRVLLVGDAAGYVDALTGEGIALGLGQARAAVACLAAGRPDHYDALARRLGRRHELLTHLLLRATSHAAVRRRLVPAATRLPRLFGMAVNQLARPVAGTPRNPANGPTGHGYCSEMEFETIHDHELGAPVRDVAQEAVDATVTVWSRSRDIDLEQSLRDELRSRGLRAVDDGTVTTLADAIRSGREARVGEHDGSID